MIQQTLHPFLRGLMGNPTITPRQVGFRVSTQPTEINNLKALIGSESSDEK